MHLRVRREYRLLPVRSNADPFGNRIKGKYEKEPNQVEQDVIHE